MTRLEAAELSVALRVITDLRHDEAIGPRIRPHIDKLLRLGLLRKYDNGSSIEYTPTQAGQVALLASWNFVVALIH